MHKPIEGSLVKIPAQDGIGLAKVIFLSEYFAEMICLKLYKKRLPEDASITAADFSGPFDLYYTGLNGFKKKRWSVVANEPVPETERTLTHRTAGGEVWVGDNHLGTATESDLATLPKMLVHGGGLIEKYASRYPIAASE